MDELAPAGWHPEPGGDGSRLRYWDGTTWTEHYAPVPAPAPPAPVAWSSAEVDFKMPPLPVGTIRAKGLNGFVEFDGKIVTVRHRGWRTTGAGGRTETRVPISTITEVRWKSPTIADYRGVIQFVAGGVGAARYGRFNRSGPALRYDNALVFGRRHKSRLLAFRAAVEQAIANR